MGVPTNDQAPLGAAITPLEEVAASLSEEDSAVLGAVEDASRPLRRCRNRHPRPRLCAALGRALPACTPLMSITFPLRRSILGLHLVRSGMRIVLCVTGAIKTPHLDTASGCPPKLARSVRLKLDLIQL